jgi:hypothetical protein
VIPLKEKKTIKLVQGPFLFFFSFFLTTKLQNCPYNDKKKYKHGFMGIFGFLLWFVFVIFGLM